MTGTLCSPAADFFLQVTGSMVQNTHRKRPCCRFARQQLGLMLMLFRARARSLRRAPRAVRGRARLGRPVDGFARGVAVAARAAALGALAAVRAARAVARGRRLAPRPVGGRARPVMKSQSNTRE